MKYLKVFKMWENTQNKIKEKQKILIIFQFDERLEIIQFRKVKKSNLNENPEMYYANIQ